MRTETVSTLVRMKKNPQKMVPLHRVRSWNNSNIQNNHNVDKFPTQIARRLSRQTKIMEAGCWTYGSKWVVTLEFIVCATRLTSSLNSDHPDHVILPFCLTTVLWMLWSTA
ncbi:hypothetical protein T4A_5797 [Trichinella pseudospiralis]|uniref:Uncharacterized protein n=1 Tax=Trichinella pseudospiralis TaxID=6337 RepID=A0A0V1FW00_TRIPS|nr:hypothetical protein T4A_5797 [Trichinella pseudospiralis]KRY90187.1 hypothetical protein T4D_2397 [Trichinella pseudospiralis]